MFFLIPFPKTDWIDMPEKQDIKEEHRQHPMERKPLQEKISRN